MDSVFELSRELIAPGLGVTEVGVVVDVGAGALLLDADDGRRDGRVGVEVRGLPLDDHLLRPLRYRLRALKMDVLIYGAPPSAVIRKFQFPYISDTTKVLRDQKL